MLTIIRRKVATGLNELWYHWCNTRRAAANRSIRQLAQSAECRGEGLLLVEALWDHPYHWVRLAILRQAMASSVSGLLGIAEASTPLRVKRSMAALGLSETEILPDKVPNRLISQARELLENTDTPKAFHKLELPFLYPPHFVYDGILKDEGLGQIDFSLPGLDRYLAKTLHYLEVYDEILNRHDIRGVVVSHPNFPRFSTLAWCALQRGIPVYCAIHANEHISIRRMKQPSDLCGAPVERPTNLFIESLENGQRSNLARHGRDYLDAVRQQAAGQFSIINIYNGDTLSRAEFAQLTGTDPEKPNVVVLTSCWSDGPNGAGPTYFTDYQDLLERTLCVINKTPDCNWFLRAHPAEFHYADKMRLNDLVSGRLPPHAQLWPEGVSGSVISGVADCVVTAAGTSGIEYTALGNRVLVCRSTAYTELNFVNWARDAKEFETKLAKAWELPLPTQRQQEDASLYIALCHTSHPDTRGKYLYQWGSRSWQIWPSIPQFLNNQDASIRSEIACLRQWLCSDVDSYNVFKWLHPDSWQNKS